GDAHALDHADGDAGDERRQPGARHRQRARARGACAPAHRRAEPVAAHAQPRPGRPGTAPADPGPDPGRGRNQPAAAGPAGTDAAAGLLRPDPVLGHLVSLSHFTAIDSWRIPSCHGGGWKRALWLLRGRDNRSRAPGTQGWTAHGYAHWPDERLLDDDSSGCEAG